MAEGLLEERFKEASVLPLWLHVGPASAHEPRPTEKACMWSWRELKSLGNTIGDEVNGADAERRVLVLANPGFGGRLATTGTLNAALQVLNPDETAAPHRHSMAALRLITDEDGGVTTVDDAHCPMTAGDLILTPAWCWHGHFNNDGRRAMWIDVLDVPLVASWNAVFIEHPSERNPLPDAGFNTRKLRYSWADTQRQLDATPANEDGSREIRYINPVDGGPVMPTIDVYANRLEAGRPTERVRSTASTLVYVLSGSGTSTVGDMEFSWSKNDVFTVPNWTWVSHVARNKDAYLIKVSNGGMLKTLGLLRSEYSGNEKNGQVTTMKSERH